MEASRLSSTALRHCKNIFAYQSNGYLLANPYYPRVLFDISKTFEQKREALACYGSEHNRFNRLFEIALKRNEVWGYAAEVEAAEAFEVVKQVI